MKQSKLPRLVMPAALLCGLVGAALRIYQFTACMEENGLVRVGSPILYLELGFTVLMLLLLGILCGGLNKTLGSEHNFYAGPGYLFFQLVGAVCVFYGAMQRLIGGEGTFLFICGMEAALCLAAAALLYGRQSKVVFWLLILSCLYFGGQLIFDFRRWSTDPLVIHFCFRLLAHVTGMLGVLHLASFPLSVGRKRLTIFWIVCAVAFTLMLIPDYLIGHTLTLGELMIPLGLTIWLASHGLCLLRPAVQNERAAAAESNE